MNRGIYNIYLQNPKNGICPETNMTKGRIDNFCLCCVGVISVNTRFNHEGISTTFLFCIRTISLTTKKLYSFNFILNNILIINIENNTYHDGQ